MSITGTGTQADPYIVETYEDLKTAVEYDTPEDLYVKFKEAYNIDLASIYESECPTIYTSQYHQHHIHIDGNGTTISGYSSSIAMFKSRSTSNDVGGYFELKNIILKNMYCPQSSFIDELRVPRLEKVIISGITGNLIALRFSWPGSTSHAYQDGWIRRCSFSITKTTYDYPNNKGFLVLFSSKDNSIQYPSDIADTTSYVPNPLWGAPITDCKFDINSRVPVIFCGAGGSSGYSYVRKTNFLRNTIILHGLTPVYHGWLQTRRGNMNGNMSFANTVIRGNSTGSIILEGSTTHDEFDGGVCVVDHTGLPNATLITTEGHTNPFNLLTAEEIKNPAYLRSIGFECGG